MEPGLLAGAVGFGGYLAATLTLLHLLRRLSPAVVVTGASIAGYVVLVAVLGARGYPVRFWPMTAAYWFLSLCFLMAFGAIYKSISLRILLDLVDRPHHADRYDAILERCVRRASYQARLVVLVDEGLATRDAGGLRLTAKARRVAAVAHALQRAFKIEWSG